jgi:hypothetical protein
MIYLLLSSVVSAILLYMHKADPVLSLFIPFLVFFLPAEAVVYFSIIFSAAILEHRSYRVPDFVLLLSIFPLFYDRNAAAISGVLFCFPILLVYILGIIIERKIVTTGDIKLFFSIGVFFRNPDYILPFYVLTFLAFVPYSLLKKKLVPFGPPTVAAAYIIFVLIGRHFP